MVAESDKKLDGERHSQPRTSKLRILFGWGLVIANALAILGWFIAILSDNVITATELILSPGIAASLLSLVAARVATTVLGAMVLEREEKRPNTEHGDTAGQETDPTERQVRNLTEELYKWLEPMIKQRSKRGIFVVFSQILALFTSLMLILVSSIGYLIQYLCIKDAVLMRVTSVISMVITLFLLVWLFMRGRIAEGSWDPIRSFAKREVLRGEEEEKEKLLQNLSIQIKEDTVFLLRQIVVFWGFTYAALDVLVGRV